MAGEAPPLDLEVSILQRGRDHKWPLREGGEKFVNGSDPEQKQEDGHRFHARPLCCAVPISVALFFQTFSLGVAEEHTITSSEISLRDTPLHCIVRHGTHSHLELSVPRASIQVSLLPVS